MPLRNDLPQPSWLTTVMQVLAWAAGTLALVEIVRVVVAP